MPTTGLLVVFSKPKPGWDEKKFNEWYSEHHLDHVNDAGISDLAVRYKNIDPNAKWPYLALYRLPDVANLADEKRVNSVAADHDLIPNGGPWIDNIDMDRRAYVTIQKFEGQIEKKGARGKAIITVTMEPGDDADFDDWYRKQHLDMLSMVPGYRRSTRHKLADEKNEDGHPRFLACHEYDTKEIPGEFVKLCVGTEWSKKIIGEAKHFGRDVWEQIAEKGAVESKL